MTKAITTEDRDTIRTLIQEANEHHNLAINSAKSTLAHARDSGARLLELKARCQHGALIKLIEGTDGLDMTMRTAQRYMQISREWDSIVEDIGSGRAAVISLSEGLRAIKAKEKQYYPDEGVKATRVSYLDAVPCPHGGPHIYDEEACINCHDPKPADATAEAELAFKLKKMDEDQELRSLFASTESLYHQLTQQLDRLQKLSPFPEKDGIQTALNMSYEHFKRWQSASKGRG